jgi:hypothetical protein
VESHKSMLAYLFWHRPGGTEDRERYEQRLIEFHESLRGAVAESAAFRLERLPFAAGGGYEDWYLIDDWPDLGELNRAAVSGKRRAPHDAAARLAAEGWGGVYRLVRGTSAVPDGVRWTSKRPGESYESFLDRERTDVVWQRQLVLGPAPEFCLTGEGSPERLRLWP